MEYCCSLAIDSLTGSSTILNPSTGGSIAINGSISDTSGKPINWELNIAGQVIPGTGKEVKATWNGKDGNSKVVTPGTYTATLIVQVEGGSCPPSIKKLDFTVNEPAAGTCGLYVNFGSSAQLASGAMTHSQELFATSGSVMPLGLSLTYDSQNPNIGSLGLGWNHSYNIFLTTSSDGSVVLHSGNSRLYQLTNGAYVSQPGDYSTLVKNEDATYSVTYKDGTVQHFAADGTLSSIIDRNGNQLSLSYSDSKLASVTDPGGHVATFSYDADNHLASVTDPSGASYTFGYGNGFLTSVTQPDGGVWRYTYDANAFMLSKTDPQGNVTTYSYDDQHRVIGSVDPEGKTRSIVYPQGTDTTRTTSFTEKDGGVWQYSYDTVAGTLNSKTDPDGGVTAYTYDANGNRLTETLADGSVTSYGYDAQGNVTSVTDSLGQTTGYSYNSFGQVLTITDPQGSVTRYGYDDKGNLTSTTDASGAVTSYGYDSKGSVTSVTNPLGQTTTISYNTDGTIAAVTDPTGSSSRYGYDASGRVINQTDANGNTTTLSYNSAGQVASVTDPQGNTTRYSYDASGNRVSQTDANGTVTRYEYNYRGQVTKVTDALGNATTFTYGATGCPSCGGGIDKLTALTDANGNTTRYGYDQLGRLVKEGDPLGNVTSYSYDAKGNLLTKTDALGRVTTSVYDPLNRVKEQIDAAGGKVLFEYSPTGQLAKVTDAIGVVTSYDYDALGRTIRTTSTDAGTISYSYNHDGTLKSRTDANGITTTYGYDAASRLVSVAYPDPAQNVTYSYDTCTNGKGKLCSTTDMTGTATYSYDSLGRMTTERKTILGVSYTTSYGYDNTGVISSITYPSGRTASYGRDQLNRITGVSTKQKTSATLASAFSYDSVGNLSSLVYGNGLTLTRSYDPLNRLQSITVPGIHSATYSRDAVGNITAIVDYLKPASSKSYQYDILNRLSAAAGPWGTLAWSYDANGNRLSQSDGTGYAYDGNRLMAVTNGTTATYRYDSAGSIVSDGKKEFIYNQNNRLIKAVENNKTIGGYVYNAKGQRTIKSTGPAAPTSASRQNTVYHYDLAGKLIEETAGDGKLLTDYVYLEGQPLAMIRKQASGEETFYYHNDHLGTPKVMTDKLGKVAWNVEFDPFGNEVSTGKNGATRSVENNLRFPGQYFDAETGLHYNYFRDYNPRTGRYVESDPIGLRGGLNRFAYTYNNPSSFIDPNGLEIAVAIGLPQGNNPFGHVAAGVSGRGVYSSGTKESFGSDFTTYIQNQSTYRDSVIFILPTTEQQDDAFVKAFLEAAKRGHSASTNNCADITGEGLKAAGLINDSAILKLPKLLLNYMILRANEGKVSLIMTITKGNQNWQQPNEILNQFNP